MDKFIGKLEKLGFFFLSKEQKPQWGGDVQPPWIRGLRTVQILTLRTIPVYVLSQQFYDTFFVFIKKIF